MDYNDGLNLDVDSDHKVVKRRGNKNFGKQVTNRSWSVRVRIDQLPVSSKLLTSAGAVISSTAYCQIIFPKLIETTKTDRVEVRRDE